MKKIQEKFDKRTKLEILNDLRTIDNKIQVPTPYKYINKNKSIFPLQVFQTQNNFCNENGYYATYQVTIWV